MTELFPTKAIVKLPRKSNRSSTLVVDTTSDYNMAKSHQQEDGFYLVTDKLYIDGLPSSVIENEIMELVASCDPIKIHLNRTNDSASGYIQFISRDMADRAYTLLNGVTFRAGIRLQLKINPPLGDYPEPEAHAGILHIKNLPSHINNKSLYELFRPFGPMMLCKILVEQGSTFKGTALVQYFNSENAQDAEQNMNNKQVQDNIITIFPVVSSKWRDSSPNSPLPPASSSSPIRSDASSMVDYTNLYIKNLDLNVKSADLFDNFRKFGRIISARVMKNAQTKQSKGFGFVSFSKADEAQKARADMNGEYILSKPVIVAFHEPKKPREANGNASPTDSSFNSQQHTKQQQQNNQQHHQNQPQNQYQQQHHQQQQQPQQQQQQQQQQQNHHQQNNQQQNHHHQQQQNNQHHHHHQQYQQNNQQHQHQHQHQQQQQQQQQQNNQHHFSPPRASVLPFNPLPNNSFGDPQTQPQQQNGYHSQANRPRDFNEHRYSLSSKPTYGQSQEYPKTYQTMERNDSRHSGYDYRTQSYVSPVKEQQHHTPLKRDLSGSGSIQPSLIGLASGAFINTPPTYYPPTTQVRPSFRRRGSVESLASVMTETSSHSRRQTVTKAVLAIEKSDDPHVHDIVDMILTLKKKDLATCLFNKVFLKAKIRQAKYALDIFQEELEEEKMGSIQYQEQQQQQQQQKKEEQVVPPAPPPPPRYQSVNALVSLPPRSSRAIPIVAPPPVVTSSSSSSLSPPSAILPPASTPSRETQQNTSHGLNDKELGEEIERFLNSLNGLELHEKKQLLGDRLFPLVKSTGVKQAPKITIKLLDSVPLDELAYSMYDKDKLKQQVSRIVTTLSSRY